MASNRTEQSSTSEEKDRRSSGAESMSFSDMLNSFLMPPNHPSRRFGKSKITTGGQGEAGAKEDKKNEAMEEKEDEVANQKAEVEEAQKEEKIEDENTDAEYEGDDEAKDESINDSTETDS